MLPLKKILFPVDFSDRCRGAAHAVRALARRFGAEVVPVHVVEAKAPERNPHTLLTRARQQMERFVAAEFSGCKVSPCVTAGDPAVSITDRAHAGHFGLIVMPTHGFGPFRRFLLGAVTAKVLHDASCPVWTCAHLEDWPVIEGVTLRNIVFGIDFGTRSVKALRCASALAAEFNANLTLAHTLESSNDTTWSREARDRALRAAAERVLKLENDLNLSIPSEILDGSPAYGLSEVAEKLNADLMVIGRAHLTADAAKLGSNAYAIIAHSPCPVLSI